MSMEPETLRVLGAVLAAVRDARGYPDLLGRLAQGIRTGIGCERVTVYMLSRRRRLFLPAADVGTPASVVENFMRTGYGPEAFPGHAALLEGRPLHLVRGQVPPDIEAMLELAELREIVVAPMIYEGKGEGALSCGIHYGPGFTPLALRALEEVAPHAALLVHTARLEAEQARLAERRARLATWAADVVGADDVDRMAERVCAASRALFRATRSALLLLRDDELVLRGRAGSFPAVAPQRLTVTGEDAFERPLRTGQPLIVNDYRNSPYFRGPLAAASGAQSVLIIPLVDAAGRLGVLTVSDTEEPFRFKPTDEEDARLLGAITTVALRKGLVVEELRQASAAKSEFLASVSHDLRTPLNVLLGYTQLLGEEAFGPITREQRDTLARMERTASSQLTLVNDLLDLARIEQGKLSCTLRPVHLGELVDGLREMMEALLRDRPVAFDVAVATDAVARTDRERMRQVLVNVLVNAAKFTQAGCVRLVAERVGEGVDVTVADTGPGMDTVLARQVTEPFVHGAGPAAGTGLGLAIVSRLLEVLGGSLAIDSAPGRGTRVLMRLPGA
jgi:signal transduction histidine kinase